MQFLKTLFWVILAVLLSYVSIRNWHIVTLNLWGNLQADIKVPVLMGLMFLLGFAPAYLFLRAREWRLKRRIESLERQLQSRPVPERPAVEEPLPE